MANPIAVKLGRAMSRYETLFLTALLIALWALMPITQMWDWDEPLYARTGIEMFLSGNLVLPRFNDEIFAHKPPLGYWLMGLSAQVFGTSEFAVRFFSAPLMAFGALMVGRTARLMFDQKIGEIAMTVMGTSLMSVYLGAAAMMDAPLFAGYALSVWAFVKIVLGKRLRLDLLAWFSLGLLVTLLVKGPVGPVLVGGMVLGAFAFLPKAERPTWTGFAALTAAGLVAVAGFLLWFLPANAASGGALVREGVGVHIIGRALAPMEGHGGQGVLGFFLFLPVYIPVLFLGMLPWSAALPQAIGHVVSQIGRRDRVLLLAWFLPTFLAFSIAATKLPHYIFPAMAPLSVAIAVWLVRGNIWPHLVARWAGLLAYLGLAIVFAYTAVAFSQSVVSWKMLTAAAIFGALGLLVLRAKLTVKTVPFWAAISLILLQGIYWLGLTEVDRLTKISRDLGQDIAANVPPDALVIYASYGEPSLIFYANRPLGQGLVRVPPRDLGATVQNNPQGFAVLTAQDLAELKIQAPQIALETLREVTAYNVNQSGRLETVYLLKWQSVAP